MSGRRDSAASSGHPHILLGHFGAAHGIRGEVVVKTLTADPADVVAYGPLHDAGRTRTFALTLLRVTPKGAICRVADVGDRTQAEALRGIDLYVDRDRLPAPAEEEFYHADLIGLAAETADGRAFGRIVAVQNFGAGDLLEIRPAAGGRDTVFLPFTRACVPLVDVAAGRVVVVPPAETPDEPGDLAPGQS